MRTLWRMRHIRTTGWMFDTSNSTSHVTIPVAAMHFCYYYSSPAVTGLMMIVIIEYNFAGSLNCKARNRISCTALMIVMKRMLPYVPAAPWRTWKRINKCCAVFVSVCKWRPGMFTATLLQARVVERVCGYNIINNEHSITTTVEVCCGREYLSKNKI